MLVEEKKKEIYRYLRKRNQKIIETNEAKVNWTKKKEQILLIKKWRKGQLERKDQKDNWRKGQNKISRVIGPKESMNLFFFPKSKKKTGHGKLSHWSLNVHLIENNKD